MGERLTMEDIRERYDGEWVALEDVEVVAHALPPGAPFDGLLGLDFLVGLRLALDMRAGELTVDA